MPSVLNLASRHTRQQLTFTLLTQSFAERAFEFRVFELIARLFQTRGLDALAAEEDFGHLADGEAEGEGGDGEDGGTAEDAAERLRELRVLGRPTIFPVPAFALRLAVGEMAGVLLGSQRVEPARLKESGYQFKHPELEGALRTALDKKG